MRYKIEESLLEIGVHYVNFEVQRYHYEPVHKMTKITYDDHLLSE